MSRARRPASTGRACCSPAARAACRACCFLPAESWPTQPILRYVDAHAPAGVPKLYPPGKETEAIELCKRLDSHLGPDACVWFYSQTLDDPALATALCAPPAPSYERLAYKCGLGLVMRKLMRVMLNVNEHSAVKALQGIREEFARLSQLLSDGRRFLCGEEFTAADLTFACLAAPALCIDFGLCPPYANAPWPARSREVADEQLVTRAGRTPSGSGRKSGRVCCLRRPQRRTNELFKRAARPDESHSRC